MPFQELVEELFYPKHKENWATNNVATTLASEPVKMIMTELTDNRKATSKHFPRIQWKYSILEIIEHIKQDGIGKKSNNSVSESGFAVFQ